MTEIMQATTIDNLKKTSAKGKLIQIHSISFLECGGGGELFSAAELKNIPRQLLSHVITSVLLWGHRQTGSCFYQHYFPT